MTRGVAGGGAEPNRAGRWLRVGPWGPLPRLCEHPPCFACLSPSSFLIPSLWSLREDLGQLGLMPSVFSFYLHRKGVLNEASIFRMRPFPGLDAPASYPILHSFWVTDDPAFPCKATWENLSCVLRVDTFPLILCSVCCQMKPEFCPHEAAIRHLSDVLKVSAL